MIGRVSDWWGEMMKSAAPSWDAMWNKIAPDVSMTDWTQQLPQTPGYYWYCDDHWTDGEVELVNLFNVRNGGQMEPFGEDVWREPAARAYWWGPIEPPPKPFGPVGEPG